MQSPSADGGSINSGISDQEFSRFQALLYKLAGIYLAPSKKVLLVGRLTKRLRARGLDSFAEYYRLVSGGGDPAELQTMVDLLTTNETYFFREPKHFDFLRQEILPKRPRGTPFEVWSAACSSGEEPYTLAMVLADQLNEAPWRITASDISTQVLERARRGHYPMERIDGIPPALLKKYCLKGVREQAGTFLVGKELRERVNFMQVNLIEAPPAIGPFDVIFLRNVMIYFDQETKRKVVTNLLSRLKSGGWFIVGHSETLNGIVEPQHLAAVRPTIYKKP
ncbi:protein-glutamate O-methyltransferase CheR [Pseudothauera nasutitermitis]|uniref:Chemotaxis protein methyltransferase n=1 Tax=Pseudothauera nasutitermitis TaxID=2565930 RepID=A0A4S4ATJ3_9RHOO|nr:protein-glutamate O-methyltransferase CheR [Pseudothauera nasutitermitis]THF63060.1 protein-glutamate O-methyltransferase CheR [Pseudothauera nasutitermitis]